MYGVVARNLSSRTWDLMRQLSMASPMPWCIIGDLNNLMSQDEKIGGALYPNGMIDGFVETMVACGLNDLGMIGYDHTNILGRMGEIKQTGLRKG